MGKHRQSSDGSAVGMILELENVTIPADASFSENSLAAKDSMALAVEVAEESIVLEHALPESTRGNHRRRRRGMIALACCLLIGIVVSTILLTKPENSDLDPTIDDGSDVGSVESDNDKDDVSRPHEYYVLAPLVDNPEALFISDTPEGDAFGLISQEGLTRYLDIVQRYALMNLFFATDGGGWTNFGGWSTRNEVCNWVGITCQNLVVTELDLDSNNLKGSIPEDFCLLSDLKKIVMGNNQNLEMPSCFDELLNLEELTLQGDNLFGGLPKNLHGLPRLAKLDLSSNLLTGPIDALFPDSVNNQTVFPSLVTLHLDDNNLSGEIPENKLSLLENLGTISISQNPGLTGSLDEICNKTGSLEYAAADCSNVSCQCCTGGTSCPSTLGSSG